MDVPILLAEGQFFFIKWWCQEPPAASVYPAVDGGVKRVLHLWL
jgi:hypothetical protein